MFADAGSMPGEPAGTPLRGIGRWKTGQHASI